MTQRITRLCSRCVMWYQIRHETTRGKLRQTKCLECQCCICVLCIVENQRCLWQSLFLWKNVLHKFQWQVQTIHKTNHPSLPWLNTIKRHTIFPSTKIKCGRALLSHKINPDCRSAICCSQTRLYAPARPPTVQLGHVWQYK